MYRYASTVRAGIRNAYRLGSCHIGEGRLTIWLSSLLVYSHNPAITILLAAGSAGEIPEAYFGNARGLQPLRLPISPYHITPEQDNGD